MVRPSYTTSKQWLWCSGASAWAVIFALTIAACLGSDQAVAFGAITVPSMVGLIVALLGVHRAFGSLDMRAMTRSSHVGRGARGDRGGQGAKDQDCDDATSGGQT